jgi:hypothetical protein
LVLSEAGSAHRRPFVSAWAERRRGTTFPSRAFNDADRLRALLGVTEAIGEVVCLAS